MGATSEASDNEDDEVVVPLEKEKDGGIMMAFDMKTEEEEGHFDESGTYIWKKEDASIQEDAWLQGVSTTGMAAAASAKRTLENKEDDKERFQNEQEASDVLLQYLQDDEKVLQALKRFSNSNVRKKKRRLEKNSVLKNNGNPIAFNAITEAADYIMSYGGVQIYDLTREEIMKKAKKQGMQTQSSSDKNIGSDDTIMKTEWEYKGRDGKVHGPYSTCDILNWRKHVRLALMFF